MRRVAPVCANCPVGAARAPIQQGLARASSLHPLATGLWNS